MVFSSIEFIFYFLTITLIAYYLPIHSIRYKNGVLLVASLFFYAWGEPVYVLLLLASIAVNWVIGLGIERSTVKKRWLAGGVIYNLAILFVFKYLGFVAHNLGLLLGRDIDCSIALPIGISFFTFQIMSYIIDLYRGKVDVQKNFFQLALYVSMFPQLIAGPIVRYEEIEKEIRERPVSLNDFSHGMVRFVMGLGKKVLLADNLAMLANSVWELGDSGSVLAFWLGAIAYTLQIYYDFSGYSDMAIGLGNMFGFHFNENFNYPYMASSLTDFWRRWHISLSLWFRDYLYIPLGGNRRGTARRNANLMIVWLLTGLWHGANWTFIVWGLVYGLFLLAEKNISFTLPKIPAHLFTMLVVTCNWVIFRSDSLSQALCFLGNMFAFGRKTLVDAQALAWLASYGVFLTLAVIGCFPIQRHVQNGRLRNAWNYVRPLYTGIVFLLSMAFVISESYSPFIYFNF